MKRVVFLQFTKDVLVLLSNMLNKDTGLIAVRIDYNYSHYIKVILDEVFSKENFINEITIGRSREAAGSPSKLEVTTESIYLYSKSNDYKLNPILRKDQYLKLLGQVLQWAEIEIHQKDYSLIKNYYPLQVFSILL